MEIVDYFNQKHSFNSVYELEHFIRYKIESLGGQKHFCSSINSSQTFF